jgi:hypothetical protein
MRSKQFSANYTHPLFLSQVTPKASAIKEVEDTEAVDDIFVRTFAAIFNYNTDVLRPSRKKRYDLTFIYTYTMLIYSQTVGDEEGKEESNSDGEGEKKREGEEDGDGDVDVDDDDSQPPKVREIAATLDYNAESVPLSGPIYPVKGTV